MDFVEYQDLACRTAGGMGDWRAVLTYGALGLTGESGKVAEIIKKAFYHGHDLDVLKIKKELGDVL